MLLHILELDPAIVAPRFFRVGDSLELSFENFLLCLEQKLLFDTLVLRLDIQLLSYKVLVAFQDVYLDPVKVWTFLITQPAEEDMHLKSSCYGVTGVLPAWIFLSCHTLSRKFKELPHPEKLTSKHDTICLELTSQHSACCPVSSPFHFQEP